MMFYTSVSKNKVLGSQRYPFTFLFLFSILLFTSCQSEDETPVFQGDIELTNQVSVDAFGGQGVKQVQGNLIIGQRFNQGVSDLKDLSALANLEEVNGDLTIWETALMNLEGLQNLKRVSGTVWIQSNSDLSSITALSGLEEINGKLIFAGNPNITTLNAFDGLRGLTHAWIRQNNALESLFDMSALDMVRLEIDGNSILRSFSGPMPTHIASLKVRHNSSLTDFDGLENTTHINSLEIWGNEQLRSLEGLDNLSSISDTLALRSNPELINLDGMPRLETGPEHLAINNNWKLESIDRFRMRSDSKPAYIAIMGNAELRGLEPLRGLERIGVLALILNNHIQDLSDLSDLKEAGSIDIGAMFNMSSIQGLEQLESVEYLSLEDNPELLNLDALSGLKSVSTRLEVERNAKLTDLCGLRPVVSSRGVTELELEENGFNPSEADIEAGNCSN